MLVFGVARKFSRPFAGTLLKILSSDWRGPRVLEAVSRAHGWLLARKPGSPPAVRGRWRAQHPRSGPRNRAARVHIHAVHGHPTAVCGEKAPVPSTTLATLQGQSTLRCRRLTECRSHVALCEYLLIYSYHPMSQPGPGAGARRLRPLTEHTPEATPRRRSGPRLSHRAPLRNA